MIYNKLNLSITDFCSKDDRRQELTGVFFTKNKTIATDSYIAIEVETPPIDIKEFPKVLETEEMKGSFIIPVKAVNKINSNIPKSIPKSANLPIIENAIFVKSKKNGDFNEVEFATTDLEQIDKVQTRDLIGDYPKIEEVYPTGEPDYKVTFNPKLLKKICDFWIKNGKEEMTLECFNGKPTIIKGKFNEQKVKAMIMPIIN